MISPTSSAASFGATTETGPGRTQLGKDEFLHLLVTQLKNQDPLSPLQAHEFAAQLAQFSSVEQLAQVNQALSDQLQTSQLSAMLDRTTFSAALIGRQVVAEGDQVLIPGSGSGQVRIEVGAGGGHAQLRLLDAAGREVAKRDLGTLPGGRQTVTLPADLPPGTWTYEVTVSGQKDVAIPVITYTTGVVDGVSFKDGRIVLRIGTMEFPLESLAEIETAVAPSGFSAPGTPAAFKEVYRGRI